MRPNAFITISALTAAVCAAGCERQAQPGAPAASAAAASSGSRTIPSPAPPAVSVAQSEASDAAIKTLVARLDLEKYKATIKGLTAFGDRRQGTDRNRGAVDWIEAQL